MATKSKIIKVCVALTVALVALIIICYMLVSSNASDRVFSDIEDVPHNKAGLLLATSPITSGGAHNFYFDNRIKAADELYKAEKIDFIIASGGDYTQTQACTPQSHQKRPPRIPRPRQNVH